MNGPRQGCAVFLGLLLTLTAAFGDASYLGDHPVRSVSGQFDIVIAGELPAGARPLTVGQNTNLLQLRPALLAVSAERFKRSLWHQLGLAESATWSGKIFLRLHPAQSLDETVTIASSPFLDRWHYTVDFPDVLRRTRYLRALSGTLLLELANRSVPGHTASPEVPAWLVDGLAQQVLGADGEKVLSQEGRKLPLMMGSEEDTALPVNRLLQENRNFDALRNVRPVLQRSAALTFDQLSWPTAAQMEGEDGGVYYASAQLFVAQLLALDHGRDKMRAFLGGLPACLNWQTAFYRAFSPHFHSALDVEKWWALTVVSFCRSTPGPRWAADYSLTQMRAALTVPVEWRSSSNSLPTHADISLQAAVRELNPAQRDDILRLKERDLGLIELRLAPPLGGLADEYRTVLAAFLGDQANAVRARNGGRRGPASPLRASIRETLRKLDTLDARWRQAEVRLAALERNRMVETGRPAPGSGSAGSAP